MLRLTCGLALGCLMAATMMAAGCQTTPSAVPSANGLLPTPIEPSGLASGIYWRPGPVSGKRWVVLLPGASGLTIFDDPAHYFRVASALNARGFDVLVVDYKRAYKESADRPDVPTGRKIAWVVERSLERARKDGRIRMDEPGAIIAWSLGAEGLWAMLADQRRMMSMGVCAAAAYYPANKDNARISTAVPLLLLMGEADDVTPFADFR